MPPYVAEMPLASVETAELFLLTTCGAGNFVGVMAAERLILPALRTEDRPHFALRSSRIGFADRGSILLH